MVKPLRNFTLFILHFTLAFATANAKTFDVDISTGRPAAANVAYYHGETIEFRAMRGRAAVTNIEYSSIYYQTNGMGEAWWKTDGLVFHPTNDVGASSYRFFLEGRDDVGRDWHANGLLRLLDSPGFEPNAVRLPVQTLDFSTVTILNPPWIEAETDPTVPAWAKAENPPTPPDPDYSTSNAALVATIVATAPAPGNYAAVSNSAMRAAETNAAQTAAIDALDQTKRSITDMAVYSGTEVWAWSGTGGTSSAVAAAMNEQGTGAEYHTIEEGYAGTGWSAVNLPDGWGTTFDGIGAEDASNIIVYILGEIDGEPFAETIAGTRSYSAPYTPVPGVTLVRSDNIPQDGSKAPLESPSFTGTPTAPTPAAGDDTTRIATTAFVKTAVDNAVGYTLPAATASTLGGVKVGPGLSISGGILSADVQQMQPFASTLAGYGITDAKIENGTITLGENSITPVTSHQDISDKEDKSNKATVLSSSSTNAQYPSAKCVYDGLVLKQDKIAADGVLKGDGYGGVSAATAGTDYATPSQVASAVADKRSITDMAVYAETETWTWTSEEETAAAAMTEAHTYAVWVDSIGWTLYNLPENYNQIDYPYDSDATTMTFEMDINTGIAYVTGMRSSSLSPTSDRLATATSMNTAAAAGTNYTDAAVEDLKVDLGSGAFTVGHAGSAFSAESADEAGYLEDLSYNTDLRCMGMDDGGRLRWTANYGENNVAYLDDLADMSNALASAMNAAEKRVAMFILPLNITTSESYTCVELKATTNNFAFGSQRVKTAYYCHTAALDYPTWDGARAYVESFVSTNYDQRSYVSIADSADPDVLATLPHSPSIVILVDVASCRRTDGAWLSSENDELLWTYARGTIAGREEDASGRARWRPCAPVKWLNAVPEWAE